MKSVACKYELVMVALCGEYPGHVLVGENPVVHAIPHDVGIEKVAIANFHPEADGLPRTVRDQMFVKFPGSVRSFRIVGPLLIDERARIAEHAMIEFGMIPGHAERTGAS